MTIPVVVSVFAFLAIAAAVDGGSLLLTWDEPVTRALSDLHSPGLDGIVRALSTLGGLTVVTLVLLLLVLLVWHECRSLALVLLGASLARPLLEWSLKELVDRPRPSLGQLVAGNGPSFPSGHVMAAFAIWGLLPPVVALVSGRRAAWWWSVGISATIIGVVAFSRVYLGVHWMSDVIGALVLGALYLLGVEWLLGWHHRRRPCAGLEAGFDAIKTRGQDRP
ncbi:MAG: phosphatase PAP2 family protein [Acidimicrobiales bacterium]|nr:phosphatase PAP2 family protein [Actinomycetota bacterium]